MYYNNVIILISWAHSHSNHFMFHLNKSKMPGHYVKAKGNKDISKKIGRKKKRMI